jgi:ABC-type sugar transport system permease subunit
MNAPTHAHARRRPVRGGWALVAPALVVLAAVTLWPFGRAVYSSLFTDSLTTPGDRSFTGTTNYRRSSPAATGGSRWP